MTGELIDILMIVVMILMAILFPIMILVGSIAMWLDDSMEDN